MHEHMSMDHTNKSLIGTLDLSAVLVLVSYNSKRLFSSMSVADMSFKNP